jgi:hypothetical protein
MIYYLTGGYISCKITPIRLVIGSWCLLTLVLLNVYNGVLISYVTATHREPALINSMNDVASDSKIRVIVNRGQGPDIVFSVMVNWGKSFGSKCSSSSYNYKPISSLNAQRSTYKFVRLYNILTVFNFGYIEQ